MLAVPENQWSTTTGQVVLNHKVIRGSYNEASTLSDSYSEKLRNATKTTILTLAFCMRNHGLTITGQVTFNYKRSLDGFKVLRILYGFRYTANREKTTKNTILTLVVSAKPKVDRTRPNDLEL